MDKLPQTTSVTQLLIVQPNGAVRQMLVDAFKVLGFIDIASVTSLHDAVHHLEMNATDWIVTPVLPEDDVNALDLLRLIESDIRLKHVRVSVLLNESEEYLLTCAYEHGLLSHHPISYVIDEIIVEFEQFLNVAKLYQRLPPLVAANYLRQHLMEKKNYQSLLALEQNLLALFPGQAKLLFHLAQAQLSAGQQEGASRTLEQLELIEPSMGEYTKRLREKYGLEIDPPGRKGAKRPKTLGVERILIVDPDSDVLEHSRDLLNSAGVGACETFEDGQSALDWLRHRHYDPEVILMEWRLVTVTGVTFIQKLREMKMNTQVVIISSLLQHDDHALLKEMGVSHTIRKPFERKDLYSGLVWAISQRRVPSNQKALMEKLRHLLHVGKFTEAEGIVGGILGDEKIDESAKMEAQAEYLFARGSYPKVENFAIKAVELGGDKLLMYNLIGKAMLKQKRFKEAMKFFESANEISNLNLERMLMLAEAAIQSDELEVAEDSLEQANKIDSENPEVKYKTAALKTLQGDTEGAKALMETMESGMEFVSLMNSRAIASALEFQFLEAQALYEQTLAALPEKWKRQRSSVRYNLGLAYARQGDLEKAKEELIAIDDKNDEGLQKKIESLIRRIDHAIKDGRELKLYAASAPELVPESEMEKGFQNVEPISLDRLTTMASLSRGDLCCFLIFRDLAGLPEKAAAHMQRSLPPFSQRKPYRKAS